MAVTGDNEFQMNISTLARATGFGRDTVRKYINENGVAPAGKRGGVQTYELSEVGAVLWGVKPVDKNSLHDPEKMEPKSRLEWFRSESERLKFQTTTRGLIPESLYRDDLYKTLSLVVAFFENLPDHMERTGIFDAGQLDALERQGDILRNELFEKLTESGSDDVN